MRPHKQLVMGQGDKPQTIQQAWYDPDTAFRQS
jgi:hypothetical protein